MTGRGKWGKKLYISHSLVSGFKQTINQANKCPKKPQPKQQHKKNYQTNHKTKSKPLLDKFIWGGIFHRLLLYSVWSGSNRTIAYFKTESHNCYFSQFYFLGMAYSDGRSKEAGNVACRLKEAKIRMYTLQEHRASWHSRGNARARERRSYGEGWALIKQVSRWRGRAQFWYRQIT